MMMLEQNNSDVNIQSMPYFDMGLEKKKVLVAMKTFSRRLLPELKARERQRPQDEGVQASLKSCCIIEKWKKFSEPSNPLLPLASIERAH